MNFLFQEYVCMYIVTPSKLHNSAEANENHRRSTLRETTTS